MPTYEYVCRECGHHVEVVQKFSDDPLQTCERCEGPLRKVFSAAGIIFKGSGYYVTDTRAGNGAKSRAGSAKSESSGDSESSGTSDTSDSSSATSDSSDTSSSQSESKSESKSA